MTQILIVYHSQTGRTEKMARAVAEGTKAIEHAEVLLKKAGETTLDDLLACSGLAKRVFTPVIARGEITEEILEQCRELGGTLAGGCEMGIY